MTAELANEAIQLLRQMIAIPSFSKEEKEIADFLEQYLTERGYVVFRHLNNIWLQSPGFDVSRPTILLNSHLDTVKPGSSWIRNPFEASLKNGKLFGLGSNDAGASLVSLLQVFFYLTQRPQPYNLIFAATAEEEISGKNGIEIMLQEFPKVDFAIVGEPTGMNMAVAERGLMVIDATVTGKSGHAAREEGENAIYKALDAINWFKNYRFAKVSPLLGPVKMTVTQINGGIQHNMIPDKCTFVVDVRSNELYSNEEILEIIRENVDCRIEPRSVRLCSTATQPDHPIIKRAQQMNLTLYGSPTLSDQALMPFPSVKIGPGDSARSHTADEYVLVEEIEKGIEVYIQLLDGLQI
ncbi:MAG TPA: M20 family metallo-hydrolase [Paludibacteraceae bacterium]|nr:M20 family metallo-hydrolase [Paludibacteraceae bacterium]